MFEGNQNNLGMLSNKIETSIENKEVTPEQLPQGSPIQQEAVQLTDNNPRNDEVANKIVDDYVNSINENFGEGIKYLKPNYETLKSMPSFDINKPETLTNSDWWNEQFARNMMYDSPKTKNVINLQPGFDYNIDAIKADYPESYYQGESPEEFKEKQRKIATEDFEETGDVGVLEEYIKLTGDVPWTDDAGYVMDNDHLWKMREAISRKYPQFFEHKSFRGEIDELADYLRNKDKEAEVDEGVNPVTAKMNEGLSEDDKDYFGPDSRIQKPIAKTGRRINA